MPAPASDDPLKLVAFDPDDLAVVSAHLQDAVVRTGDLAFLPESGRFALVARRYDWDAPETEPRRRLTGFHFERVKACRTRGIDRGAADKALNLLAVTFEDTDAPSGRARLVFSGDACIELDCECLEAKMKDLGPAWSATGRPAHDREPA